MFKRNTTTYYIAAAVAFAALAFSTQAIAAGNGQKSTNNGPATDEIGFSATSNNNVNYSGQRRHQTQPRFKQHQVPYHNPFAVHHNSGLQHNNGHHFGGANFGNRHGNNMYSYSKIGGQPSWNKGLSNFGQQHKGNGGGHNWNNGGIINNRPNSNSSRPNKGNKDPDTQYAHDSQ